MRVSLILALTLVASSTLLGQYNNVPYVPLYTDATFTRTINTALAVGAVGAKQEVSLSGAATYNVPVVIPPGTNNMVPSLAVAYNSLGTDGHLGMSWGLSGLSVITRVDKDFFHDNQVQPLALNSGDQFALDGNRLVVTTGSYGANGSIYATKEETFSRITSYGSLGGSPQWFKVEAKDGLVYEYGNTADSRFLKEDNSIAVMWRLNKVYDQFGNYVEFKYKTDERDSRIDEINYTGNSNTGMLPYNKIKFVYEYRTDKKTMYVGGSALNTNFLLTRIQVKAENNASFKEYEMLYSFDNVHSFLKEIIEWGDDGTRLNATLFKYGNQPSNLTPALTNQLPGDGGDIFSGDFNGDGLTDLIVAPYQYVNGLKYHTEFQIHTKNPAPSNNFTFAYTSGTLPIEYEVINGKQVPSAYAFMADDYNGDGRDDILVTRKVQSGGYRRLDLVRVYFSANEQGSSYTQVNYPTNSTFDIIHPNGNYIHLGDLDGDGRGEVLTMRSNGTNYKAFVLQPDVSSSVTLDVWIHISGSSYQTNATAWVDCDFISVLDFDGDGKNEIMIVDESTCKIYTFKTFLPASNLVQTELIYNSGYPTKWHKIHLGDFNGDRKTDLLTRTNQGLWEVASSTGKGFNATTFNFNTSFDLSLDALSINDCDGDGKSDIVHHRNHWVGGAASNSYMEIYYNRGNTFFFQQNYLTSILANPSTGWRLVPGDFDGDGKRDLIRREYYLDPLRIFYFKKGGKDHLLEKIANGFNHLTTFNYNTLTAAGSFYSKGGSTAYPLNNIQLPLYAVSSMSVSNGIGGTNTTNYTYEQAKLHRRGRGWLGFAAVHASNSVMNRKVTSRFEFNTTFYVAMLQQTEEYRVDNSGFITLNQATNSVASLSNGRYWPRTDQTTTQDWSKSFYFITAFTYDSYGNVTQEVHTRKLVGSTVNQEITTTTSQFATHGSWIPSRPTQTTISNVRGAQAAYSKTVKRTFNTQGALTQEIDFFGLTKAVTKNYTLNSFGNLASVSTSASGLAARNITYGYDTKGRFLTTITNPLNQTETISYSVKWGLPISKTSISGLTTTYEYDGFGRVKKTTSPEGNITQTSRGWDVQGSGSIGATTIVYYTNTQVPGRPDMKEWIDVLGRSRYTETEGMNYQWIRKQTTYDARGNIATTTAPFFTGGPTGVLTTITYDALNRMSTAVVSGMGTTYYTYAYPTSGYRTVITRPDGLITTQTIDPSGRTVETTDPAGTPVYDTNVLSFEYNSQGNQTKVKLGTVTLSTMAYDEYGRQTQLSDNNAGLTQYVYNAYGELQSQTDANNNTHQMTYDVLGRETQRTGPEGTTTYEYITVPSGLNLVKKITGFSGIIQEYAYDTYSRLTQDKETIDGVAYTTNFTYNSYGDVTAITYPSGFGITRQYDANGYLNTVKNAAGTITMFTSGGLNAYGQYTNYTLGNGITTQITYNTYGFPTRYLAGAVQDLNMNFNIQNGNLTSRYDAKKGKTETFTYDNIDRLASSQVTGQSAITMTYAVNGNINSKTDVGNYAYYVANSNKVDWLSNPSSAIPGAFQSITYTAFHQPNVINEGIYNLAFTYASDYERRKTVLKQNNVVTETRYFLGSYEKQVIGATTRHIHYISGGNGLNAIVVRENGTDTYNYVYTDHIGSILTVTSASGTVVAEQNFDAWGRSRNPVTWAYTGLPSLPAWLYRGYTGHEHLPQFSLINMNGRLYDPYMGRMLSTDNYVQNGLFSQAYNRYSYALNNPLKFVDRDGEFAFIPILIGILTGAAIGAVTSAAIYTATTLLTGQPWTWKGFGRAAAFGAVGGAISGGLGAAFAGSAFAQSLGFGIIKNVASTVGTNLAFGQDITAGAIVGAVAGGLIMGSIPQFSGVKGGALVNAAAEIGYSAATGAVSGAFGGALAAAVDGGDIEQGFVNGARNGAIGGAVSSGLMIAAFGSAIKPDASTQKTIDKMGAHLKIPPGRFSPVFRRGGIYGLFTDRGVTWGRNLVVPDDATGTYLHEYVHYLQQIRDGWAHFQGKGIYSILVLEQILGLDPYNMPGNYEAEANKWEYYFLRNR